MRLRLDLAYDGSGFHGWAAQPGLRTVQGTVEYALATVLRLPSAVLTCAGRTDAGVHARGQVAHLDVGALLDPATLLRRVNGVLRPEIAVRSLGEAPDGFDARFSATWRRYAYRLADDAAAVDPTVRGFVVPWPRRLDVEAMQAAADLLRGEHDFAAFCRRREGATTVRRLIDLRPRRAPDGVVITEARADAFCHGMVRSLLGCLVAVGEGRREPHWAGDVLRAAVRDPAVTVMPAHGLVLEEVGYPADADLGARAVETRRVRSCG